MKKHWCFYAAGWTGCVVFYLCYQFWFSYLVLVAVTALPVLSLVLSLPVMLTAKLHLELPGAVARGTQVTARLYVTAPLPLPVWRARLSVGRELTGESWLLEPGQTLPTDHCGFLDCGVFQPRIYDYLGLFYRRLPLPKHPGVAVRPVALEGASVPSLHPSQSLRWKAKRGGGFSENYELRLYQPGDSIQHIHWKLSGKTGKLMLREPMEPDAPPILGIALRGTPAELDEKLDLLYWTAQELLGAHVGFQLLALTAMGQRQYLVADESSLLIALDQVMAQGPCGPEAAFTASRPVHTMGGAAHEE